MLYLSEKYSSVKNSSTGYQSGTDGIDRKLQIRQYSADEQQRGTYDRPEIETETNQICKNDCSTDREDFKENREKQCSGADDREE